MDISHLDRMEHPQVTSGGIRRCLTVMDHAVMMPNELEEGDVPEDLLCPTLPGEYVPSGKKREVVYNMHPESPFRGDDFIALPMDTP